MVETGKFVGGLKAAGVAFLVDETDDCSDLACRLCFTDGGWSSGSPGCHIGKLYG